MLKNFFYDMKKSARGLQSSVSPLVSPGQSLDSGGPISHLIVAEIMNFIPIKGAFYLCICFLGLIDHGKEKKFPIIN